MNSETKLLVVDDEPNFVELVSQALEDSYSIESVTNSGDCLSILGESEFDLVLLDVQIDNTNGFELCEHIKSSHPKTDVIFISGLSRQEDIVKGYQVGGTDYLTKPIRLKELKEKISTVLTIKEKLKDYESEISDARQVTFSAMADSSQLGSILEFMENSINCVNINQVSNSLRKTCELLGLLVTVYIETPHEKVHEASGDSPLPLEILLIEQVRHQGRIIDFNNRTLYNDQHVTLLVKNMPLDDPKAYGRFKDSLATLVCGANSRVRSILNEDLLAISRDAISKALVEIEERVTQQSVLTTAMMKDFMFEMESALLVLDLSEAQEQYVLSIVDSHLAKVVELVTSASRTQQILQGSLAEIQESSST